MLSYFAGNSLPCNSLGWSAFPGSQLISFGIHITSNHSATCPWKSTRCGDFILPGDSETMAVYSPARTKEQCQGLKSSFCIERLCLGVLFPGCSPTASVPEVLFNVLRFSLFSAFGEFCSFMCFHSKFWVIVKFSETAFFFQFPCWDGARVSFRFVRCSE